jgi:hypothetical protein
VDVGFMTAAATITHMTDGNKRIPIDSSPSNDADASTTTLPANAGRDSHPATAAINGTVPIATSPTYHHAGELPSWCTKTT